jgi:hypothetical protein
MPGTIDRTVIDGAPEDGAVETGGPERQPSQQALNRTDQNRALERRASDRHEFSDHSLLVRVGERQVGEHGLEKRRAAGQEKEHRVEQHEEVKGKHAGRTGRGREHGEEKRARPSHQLASFGEDLPPIRLDALVAGDALSRLSNSPG